MLQFVLSDNAKIAIGYALYGHQRTFFCNWNAKFLALRIIFTIFSISNRLLFIKPIFFRTTPYFLMKSWLIGSWREVLHKRCSAIVEYSTNKPFSRRQGLYVIVSSTEMLGTFLLRVKLYKSFQNTQDRLII